MVCEGCEERSIVIPVKGTSPYIVYMQISLHLGSKKKYGKLVSPFSLYSPSSVKTNGANIPAAVQNDKSIVT